MPMGLMMLLVPILAAVAMQHADFATTAESVTAQLATIEGEAVRTQLQTPLVLTRLLPAGLMGMLCAMMLAAFISTHDTYLHSWGSIFVQDVVMPFRKKPLDPRTHLRALRISYVGVALFAFFFSWLYVPTEAILLFFAATAAIFAGWSGIVTIGGLYTRWGSTPGAWAALVVGGGIPLYGVVAQKIDEKLVPLNGQELWAAGMAAAIVVYVLFSLLRPGSFDLDRLLRRGKHEVPGEREIVARDVGIGWRIFAMGPEFTRGDRTIYILTYVWTFLNIAVFVAGTTINLTSDVSDEAWLAYWKIYVWVNVCLSGLVILWFGIGGIRDIRRMLARLAARERDAEDDGFVRRGG
jgi:SSS family solute:Na+ symporter